MSSHTETDVVSRTDNVVSHPDRCTLISAKYFFVSRQMSSYAPTNVGSRTTGVLFLNKYLYVIFPSFTLADIPSGATEPMD